jgi:hypothetical protein
MEVVPGAKWAEVKYNEPQQPGHETSVGMRLVFCNERVGGQRCAAIRACDS